VVLKFDASGKLVTSFGSGMFIFPHGIHVDKDGNVWVTDARAATPEELQKARPPSGDETSPGRRALAGGEHAHDECER